MSDFFVTLWTIPCQATLSLAFSRQKYWSRFLHALLQGIFLTQGLNWSLLRLLHSQAIFFFFFTISATWLLSHFSCFWLCATPETAAHQAPPSLGFSRQEHWSGLPFPFPMHESEKWKWSHSVVSDSQRPHGLQPTRLLLHPLDFPGKPIKYLLLSNLESYIFSTKKSVEFMVSYP